MKNAVVVLFTVGGGLLFVSAVAAGFRLFSNATTTVTVVEPEPGVRCAKMVTGDGAAISCWVKP